MSKSILRLITLVCILMPLLSPAEAAGIKLENELTHERSAHSGEVYSGSIVLRNTDSDTREARIYQTDYSYDASGANKYEAPGTQLRSNAKWIYLKKEMIKLPPNGVERVEYEVRVPGPTNGQLSGTYWSMIMVEPIPKESAESDSVSSGISTNIKQLFRYGIQIVTNVGKAPESNLSFTNPQVLQQDNKRIFTVDVENTSQRSLRPGLSLELYSDSGNPIGKFKGAAQRLYPGTSVRFRIDLDSVPPGKYLGLVVADGTGDDLFGANVELEVE